MRSVVVSEIGGGTRDDLFLQCQVKTGVYGPDVQRAGDATATYKAPPSDRVQKLARHCVLQPRVPELVKLMESVAWRRGILWAMGPEGMAAADTGCAHLDKGMADEGGLRIVRRFELNKEGEFVDHKLEQHAPLLFALLKIIMEEHEFDQVALQKMLYQMMHCDPHGANAKPELDAQECHVLLTVNGDHALGISTSSKIQTLDERFRTWTGGGRAANKISPGHLDDVLLVPRSGPWPLQVVCQSMLGGFDSVALEGELEPIITVHAGVPCDIKCDSGGPGHRWMTAREYGELLLARKKAFREPEGEGTSVSTCMLGNYFGTQKEAAAKLEDAARRVLQAHQGIKRVSENPPVRFHERDLDGFKEMLAREEITTLARHHQNPFWSAGRKEKHAAASVAGGACAKGPMTEPEQEKHAAACVAGGGSAKGAMTEPERDKHRALQDQGHLDKHRTMMQLANGKVGQQNLWECSISNKVYRFRAVNQPEIDGVRNFETYLLDVQNGYVHGNLTEEGAEARIAMEKKRKSTDNVLARRDRKRQRQGK